MNADFRTILLVQDGSEIIRQSHADSTRYFEELVSKGHLETRNLKIKSALDGDVGHELAGASPDEYACIIFTSNALIRPDGPISQTFVQRAQELEAYVQAGGGLIFLHQSFADDTHEMVELTSLGRLVWQARASYEKPAQVIVMDPDSAVLHFPHALRAGNLAEQSDMVWRHNFPLYYRTFSLDGSGVLYPVLNADDGSTLLAIGENTGRIAFTCIPCDWARAGDLLENLIAYVIDGLPDVVVVDNRRTTADDADVDLALARIGGELPVARIDIPREGGSDANSSYLLSRSSLCLLIGEHPDPMAADALRRYVAEGGSVAHLAESSGLGYQRLDLYLGSRFGRELAAQMLDELTILDLPRWTSSALIFDIRDVWLAAEAAEVVAGQGSCISGRAREAIRKRCRQWLAVGQSVVDPGTGVLVLWLLDHFGGEGLSVEERQWLDGMPNDLAPEMELLRRSLEGQSYWDWLVDTVSTATLTSAGAVRLLDSITCARSSELSNEVQGASAAAVVTMLAQTFATSEFSKHSGWISVDGTAAAVSGLAGLATEKFTDELLSGVLTKGSRTLIRENRVIRMGRSHGPLTALRVHTALLRLELASPLGAHRAILKLADRGGVSADSTIVAESIRASLRDTQEHLARSEEHSIAVSWQLENLRVRSVEELRVAAAVGRFVWAALFVLTLVLVGYSGYATAISFSSGEIGNRLAAITTLAAALPVLGATWLMGERFHLQPRWLRIGRHGQSETE